MSCISKAPSIWRGFTATFAAVFFVYFVPPAAPYRQDNLANNGEITQFNSFAAFLGASVGVQVVFVSVMTTRTSFPQRGQRISTSEPLSPLHNLYPHIGHDAYIFIIS